MDEVGWKTPVSRGTSCSSSILYRVVSLISQAGEAHRGEFFPLLFRHTMDQDSWLRVELWIFGFGVNLAIADLFGSVPCFSQRFSACDCAARIAESSLALAEEAEAVPTVTRYQESFVTSDLVRSGDTSGVRLGWQ